jgi:hypothetical protein
MAISTLPVSPGSDVMEQAQERLRAVLYISCRDIRCEYRHGLLILRGQVASYYEKQLAQEAVARLEGVAQVVNEIEVAWVEPQLATETSAMIPTIHADRDSVATNLPSKYQHALQCEDAEERCRCLKEAAEAGYIPAMCDYGLMCPDAADKKRWLLEAACEGYTPAMYHYALACDDGERRKWWLQEAARNGHVEAMYQYSLECDDATEALHWLHEASLEGHPLAVEAWAMRCEERARTPGCSAYRAATVTAGSLSDEPQ